MTNRHNANHVDAYTLKELEQGFVLLPHGFRRPVPAQVLAAHERFKQEADEYDAWLSKQERGHIPSFLDPGYQPNF